MPSVPWQRCVFHLCQNAQHYAPNIEMRGEIAQAVKDIYLAIDRAEGKRRLKEIVEKFERRAEKFCNWLEENFEEGMTFYSFPRSMWKKIRTVNMVENLNKEIRRRTNVVKVFPNEESALRLITAVLADKHEEWTEEKIYLKVED